MIKAVIFDLDNTLYDYTTCDKHASEMLCNYACDKYGISPEVFYQKYEQSKKSVKDKLGNVGASHNRILFMQNFLENLGKLPANGALDLYDVYWNDMLNNMKLFPYVEPLLDYLEQNSIKIALLTDLTAHIQHRKIKALGLENRIKILVTSEEAGEEKPSGIPFELIRQKLNVPAKEILMIGDNYDRDITGALNAGMKALHFKKELADNMKDLVISNISST